MIPLDLENWHIWLKSESRAIRGLRADKKEDPVHNVFLEGYFAHYKLTCKQFAEQVRMKRYFKALDKQQKVGQN